MKFVKRHGLPETLGHLIEYCIVQGVYMNWQLRDLERLFIPPMSIGQYREIYNSKEMVGFVSWALLNDDTTSHILKYGSDPRQYEWKSGRRLWIIDFSCEASCATRAALELSRNILGFDEIVGEEPYLDYGLALRRTPNGHVRKVSKIYPGKGRLKL